MTLFTITIQISIGIQTMFQLSDMTLLLKCVKTALYTHRIAAVAPGLVILALVKIRAVLSLHHPSLITKAVKIAKATAQAEDATVADVLRMEDVAINN